MENKMKTFNQLKAEVIKTKKGEEVYQREMERLVGKYAGRSKEEWIAWAKKEIEEYKEFIKFLKGR